MKKKITLRAVLICAVFALNLLFYLGLVVSAEARNIFFALLFLLFYRLSLWASPFWVTVFSWLPLRPKRTFKQKAIINAVCLAACFALFLIYRLAVGMWY
jgi:uncharacterized membrane protein